MSLHETLATATLDPARMLGAWAVLATNLALWRSRRAPRLVYERLSSADAPTARLSSVAHYEVNKRGAWKPGRIAGFETQSDKVAGAFQWRGAGCLSGIVSRWCVVACGGPESGPYEWALVYFTRTAFTAEGCDLYVRDAATFTQAQLDAVLAEVARRPALSAKWTNMFFPARENGVVPALRLDTVPTTAEAAARAPAESSSSA